MKKSKVPDHLSEPSKEFFRRTLRKFKVDGDHQRLLLAAACEALDRMTQARLLIAEQGLTVTNRHGESRPHPAVGIERDSAIRFARMLRELGLADDVADNRPPALQGRYVGRE